jgi:choloylglycine hydrolase
VIFPLLALSMPLFSCTGIRLTATDGASITGRTVEFGVPIDMVAAVIPRGYAFTGKTPNGPGLRYTAKYAVVGAYCFDDPVLMDGLNEKGLSAAAFYFPGYADYAPLSRENQNQALSPIEFPNWILTQFASLDEVRAALSSVAIVPTITPAWGPTPATFHYVVYDKEGNSLVIEPLGGKLVAYDNQLGVITNSPTFDWHMTNLRNFINLSPYNVAPLQLGEVQLAPFGQGSGLVGLPGDFTPPSRFIRAALFSAAAKPPKEATGAVFQVFHILNQFDIPLGAARQKTPSGIAYDFTMMTCARDPQSLKFYYKSYEDQTIRYIDLKKFDLNAKTIKKAPLKGAQQAIDASDFLRP